MGKGGGFRRPALDHVQEAAALKLNTLQSIVMTAIRKYELTIMMSWAHDVRWRKFTVRNDADLYDVTIRLRSLDERARP